MNKDDLMSAISAMNRITRDTRSKYHLTLGKAIERLKEVNRDWEVRFGGDFMEADTPFPGHVTSFRGFYEDLAIVCTSDPCTVQDLLDRLEGALGGVFQGYKGGDFLMDERTPLWQAQYGDLGYAIVGMEENDGLVTLVCLNDDD